MEKVIQCLQEDICVEGKIVTFKKEITRETYNKIKTIFLNLGGVWVSGDAQHFEFTEPIQGAINTVIKSKKVPKKNPNAFFPTPLHLVDDMVRMADYEPSMEVSPKRVLEPSAGKGAILDFVKGLYDSCKEGAVMGSSVVENFSFDCVETLPSNVAVLKEKGYKVHDGDFMAYENGLYDYIFMNPPFSLNGDSAYYIDHIMRAYGMLEKFGVLVAIAPSAFTTKEQPREKALKALIARHGMVVKNQAESFLDVGTKVDTVIIVLHEGQGWKEKPHQGYDSYFEWSFALQVENEASLEQLFRKKGDFTDAQIMDMTKEYLQERAEALDFYPMDSLQRYQEILRRQQQYVRYGDVQEEVCKSETIMIDAETLARQREIARSGGSLLDMMGV